MKMNLKLPLYFAALVILVVILGVGLIFFKTKFGATPVVSTLPKVEVSQAQLIPGFPDFPVYPKANIQSSQHTEATSAPEYSVASYQAFLETTDSPAQVMAWYISQLQTAGWQVVRPLDASQLDDQNVILSKNGQVATINAEKESDEGTTVSIYIK